MKVTSSELGTEDLETGMRPSRAREFAVIAAIAVLILLVFNSQSLVDWTRQPQPGPVIAALEGPAVTWNRWMQRIGTGSVVRDFRTRVQRLIEP